MALGSSNITTAAVNTELGSPYTTPRLISQLCSHANAGTRWSFYGTGTLGVDANKTVVWTAPSSNYKFGDFRLYNRTASTPSAPADFTWYWGPGGSTTDIPMVCFPQALNVLFINTNAIYLTYKAYLSTANRAAETSVYDTFTEAWSGSTISLLAGHTRTQTTKIDPTHVGEFTAFASLGLSDPDYIYFDVYLSDISGNRLINLGSSVSGGYFTLTLRKNSAPQINASGNCVSRSGYTGTFTAISNSSTECSSAIVAQTVGSYSYNFRITAVGIQSGSWNINPSSCTIIMYTYSGLGVLKDTTTVGTSQNLNDTTSTAYSGTKAVAWAYNDYAVVSITSVTTWGTAGTC